MPVGQFCSVLLTFLVMPLLVAAQNDVAPPPPQQQEEVPRVVEEEETFGIVEEMALFPGGEQALNAYLASHVKYPKDARKKGVEGKVFVRFVVEKDGTVGEVTLLRGIADWPSMNEAALNGVRELPAFVRSARQNGQPVRVQYTVPITFKLE